MLKIKELREEFGFTQKELAEKVATTNKNIWAYEKGLAQPSIDALIKFAQVFNVSVDYLIGNTNDVETNFVSQSTDLSRDEQRLLRAFNVLDNITREKLIDDAEFYAKQQSPALKKQKKF